MVDGQRTSAASDDHALVRSVLAGNRAELPRLAERMACVPRLLRLLDQRRGGALGVEERADLAQDVTVRIWRKLEEYEGSAPFEGWVWGFCLLEYQNAVRRKSRLRHETEVAARLERGEGVALDPDPWAHEDVHAGLRRIGREEARVIQLKHFEGLTFEEIGLALDLSPNTVKARYYRGLRELRPLLDEGGAR